MKAGSTQHDAEIKIVGKSGQISLGKSYAGKMLRLERFDDGRIILTAVAVVPESQIWTLNEPDRSRIQRGLEWAAKVKPNETDLESLVKRGEKRRSRHVRGRDK
jgi:hypothetical protein